VNENPGKRVLVVIAFEGFRDEEYLVPREAFEQAGVGMTVCASSLGTARGKLGARVEVDVPLAEARADGYDAVVFVGGPGSKAYWDDETAHALARAFDEAGKLVCAICSAPITLARAGVLEGRSATCFEGDRAELERAGATYTGAEVTLDGRLITGSGPAAAEAFAHTIIERLCAGAGR
jgi:protease I